MAKKHTITITKPEAHDILFLIETNKREGWRLGRKDSRINILTVLKDA